MDICMGLDYIHTNGVVSGRHMMDPHTIIVQIETVLY